MSTGEATQQRIDGVCMLMAMMALFLSVMTLLNGLLHRYLWIRLVRDPGLPAPWSGVVTVALTALAVLIPATFALLRHGRYPIVAPLFWVAFIWMGVFFFLFVGFAFVDTTKAILAAIGVNDLDPERRRLLARVFGGAVAALSASASAVAAVDGLSKVAVRRVEIPLAKWRPALSGYRIVQLTDIHVGPTIGREFVDQIVETTNAMNPDLVVITGDLVDGTVDALGKHVEPLGSLRARDGVYFVTGNHEYYSGVEDWLAFIESIGIRVLRNERVPLGGEDGFDLAGVDDASAHRFGNGHGMDVSRATKERDPSRPLILLAHQPKAIKDASVAGVDLQLSGHTHGGQLVPFNWLVRVVQPFVAGLFEYKGTTIYVSRGTGYWGPPMRLGAPAEITEILVHSA